MTEIPLMRTLVTIVLLLASSIVSAQKTSNQEYIELYKDIAMHEMREHKIPASITLAQGILESGSGNSRLATQGNNHFGIKCKKNWTGKTIIEDDDEKNECFRAYENAHDSYHDHSLFLRENTRYAFLFELSILDYKGWAEGLRTAGYATNQRYPILLIGIIERLNLAKFDSLVFYGLDTPVFYDTPTKPLIQIVDNKIPITIAKEGQGVNDIAKENNMRDWQIYKYNDLPKGSRIEPGMVIYLKPKRNKAAVPEHKVQEGESMWEISQKYGIKLKKLYKKNRMEPGTQVKPGETINMRRKTKVMPDTGTVIPTPKPVTSVQVPKITPKPDTTKPSTPTHYPEKPSISERENPKYHYVATGETIFSIANTLNVKVDSLIFWNDLPNFSVQVGQKLLYFSQEILTPSTYKKVNHTVLQGQTLFSIARLYGVTVDEIAIWNNLPNNAINVGQVLVVEDRR